jgi:hypothetical protein
MTYQTICNYCGDIKFYKKEAPTSNRCRVCESVLRLREHESVDYYVGCPPFLDEKQELTYGELLDKWAGAYGNKYD